MLDGVQIPLGRGNFEGKGCPDMPFGLWTLVGPRKRSYMVNSIKTEEGTNKE